MAHAQATTLGGRVKAWAAGRVAEWTGTRAFFRAGTPLEGQYGSKPIESFRSYEECGDECDWIVSRNEYEEDGILTLRRVLRVFVRMGLVLNLMLPGGIIIGTTGEHPFWLRGKGWTPAQELKPGDQIRLMQPGWVTVEGVEDTGLVETVYNLEIEDDHTYFVGCDEWGFSVWAHNNNGCTGAQANAILRELGFDVLQSGHATKLGKLAGAGHQGPVVDFLRWFNGIPENHPKLQQLVGRLETAGGGTLKAGHPPFEIPFGHDPRLKEFPATPAQRVVPADVNDPHVVYTLDGQKPVRIDFSEPRWFKTHDDALSSYGVYIIRDAETNQVFFPGSAGPLKNRMMTYFYDWMFNPPPELRVPLVADVYPVKGNRLVRGRIEHELRTALGNDKWNMPKDFENISDPPALRADVVLPKVGRSGS